MEKIRVMSVFGTRPEAIKMLPLVREIMQRPTMESIVCVTAQHREMLDQVLESFKVSADIDLDLMSSGQTLTDITSRVLIGMESVLKNPQPDIVLVHGDTTTSTAAALATFYQQIPVGHVEAGLRTFDRYSPFPEEMNRSITGRIATLHFAPTELNKKNLLHEGISDHIYITGNTVIDALLSIVRDDYAFKDETLRTLDLDSKRNILLTCHRRENLGGPMRNIFSAMRDLALKYSDVQIIYPMHKNPAVREPAQEILGDLDNVVLIEPITVEDMHNLFARCFMVMTDSGGIQEEAPALGKPVLVLRTETERPEAVESGTVKVVGVQKDEIFEIAETLLNDPIFYEQMALAKNPYGDGHASERICDAIEKYFDPSR